MKTYDVKIEYKDKGKLCSRKHIFAVTKEEELGVMAQQEYGCWYSDIKIVSKTETNNVAIHVSIIKELAIRFIRTGRL